MEMIVKVLKICFVLTLVGVLYAFSTKKKPQELLGQTAPPDMVYIKGKENIPSFYIGVSEEPNINYIIYLSWVDRVFPDFYEVRMDARIKTSNKGIINKFNDPSMVYHMEHPAFSYYPIVGISWHQVQNYITWRTDRFNEDILMRKKIVEFNPQVEIEDNNFHSEAYLYGQYDFMVDGRNQIENPDKLRKTGLLTASYRLPTEAEWEMLKDEQNEKTEIGLYPYGKNYAPFRWMRYFNSKPDSSYTKYDTYIKKYDEIWKTNGAINPMDYNNYTSGLQGPYLSIKNNKPSNVVGNVREWLLDLYYDEPQLEYTNFQSHLRNNGFYVGKEIPGMLDVYGDIEQKDSIGRLTFMHYGQTGNGDMLHVGRNLNIQRTRFTGTDTVKYRLSKTGYYLTENFDTFYAKYKNAIFNKYLSYSNINGLLNTSYYFYYVKNLSVSNTSLSVVPSNLDQDSIFVSSKNFAKMAWEQMNEAGYLYLDLVNLNWYKRDESGPFVERLVNNYEKIDPVNIKENRVVRGGTWKDPDFNYRESVHPDSARTDIGFRVLLPYSGTPINKKYKVKWD